ncbi:MAG: assimilatory sulfite reductase (NADPH) hemoprotein subunit [Thiothrix sp.]|nr:assimilatory sulfite reductase (NADPH) hemoprotein subunit [Thiothrix sp.]HPQ94769.1 assimilatory sulfite reductase (NADPH) hemoprotein subunit [Thiolinea sp.]
MTRPSPKPLDVLAQNGSEVERIKDQSHYLRGTLVESFANPLTGSISADDHQLIKFHGTYEQDDRDRRLERQERKLEPAYAFMIRLRLPGGDLTAQQWQTCHAISEQYGDKSFRLTTRQAIQFHGIIKFDLKKTIQAMHQSLLDSIAGCGDVNRNVVCAPDPALSSLHAQVYPWASKVSEHLLPQSRAYHEIWLDEPRGQGRTRVAGGDEAIVEPLYGRHYLPRKFKVGIAIPPHNEVDVHSNDVGVIAIADGEKLAGFNIVVGGGLGMTFGREDTYARLASDIGFCTPEQLLDTVYHIVAIQRDFGNRQDRRLSRLKYTIDQYGLDWLRQELTERCGFELQPARAVIFTTTGDRFGWSQTLDGRWHLGLRLEYGRVVDTGNQRIKTALLEIAQTAVCGFRVTPNQNLLLTGVEETDKAGIEAILKAHGYAVDASHLSGLRRNSIACVALNTCPQAMAEAERYLPTLINRLEPILDRYGLLQDEIKIRMTGCPNGCGRSVMAEIGLIGKSPGRYNLYLGGAFNGERLNTLYRENLDEAGILAALEPVLADYADQRKKGESFGDFARRREYVQRDAGGIEYVPTT